MGFVFQRVYTEKFLERFEMHEANPVATLYDRNSGGTEDSVGSHVPYREAVRCLMYLLTGTRPDIAFAVSRAARAMDQPTDAHWIDVKRILNYWRRTRNYGLLYGAGNSKGILEAFGDANFAGDVRIRRSTSRVLAVCAGSEIAWSSKYLLRTIVLTLHVRLLNRVILVREPRHNLLQKGIIRV